MNLRFYDSSQFSLKLLVLIFIALSACSKPSNSIPGADQKLLLKNSLFSLTFVGPNNVRLPVQSHAVIWDDQNIQVVSFSSNGIIHEFKELDAAVDLTRAVNRKSKKKAGSQDLVSDFQTALVTIGSFKDANAKLSVYAHPTLSEWLTENLTLIPLASASESKPSGVYFKYEPYLGTLSATTKIGESLNSNANEPLPFWFHSFADNRHFFSNITEDINFTRPYVVENKDEKYLLSFFHYDRNDNTQKENAIWN